MPILARSSSSSEVRAARMNMKKVFHGQSRSTISPPPTACSSARAALDQRKTGKMVDEALAGCDDGELFLEYVQSEGLSFDDGKLKSASYDTTQGFGLRAVSGEATGFAHASALDEQALKRAAATVQGGAPGQVGQDRTNRRAAPTGCSMPTTIRSTARPSTRRSRCCRRSTPTCAARSPRRGRSRSRSRGHGRSSRSSGPAAGAPPTCGRWSG